jgi:Xaa-Pro aminopeptidase
MILSDEPGYYEDGKFGIRIENIVKIVPADTKHNFQGTVPDFIPLPAAIPGTSNPHLIIALIACRT